MTCGMGGAATLRSAQCTVARGTRAPWYGPRRGSSSPHVSEDAKQDDGDMTESASAAPLAAGALVGGATTSPPGSPDSIARSLQATSP